MPPESDELSQDIKEIKWHQEAIDASMEMLIRANRKQILAEILEFFGTSKRRAQVYLAVDGEHSVNAIADLLQMKHQNVSRDLMQLKDFGLIEIKSVSGGTIVYRKRKIDRVVGLSRELERKFQLKELVHEPSGPTPQEDSGGGPQLP